MGCVDELVLAWRIWYARSTSGRCLCGSARGRSQRSSTAAQLSGGHVGSMRAPRDDATTTKKNEKMEKRNTFSGRYTSSVWAPTMQSHIATSLGPHTSSGGLRAGSDQFGVSSTTTRTRLGRSRSSSTLRTTFSRPGPSSRTASRRATATWGPRRRRGVIWAAPTTAALTRRHR